MIIPIDAEQRIVGRSLSWDLEILHTPKKEDREPYWKAISYYGTLSQALSAACEREIRIDEAEGIAECLRAAQRVCEKYADIFAGPGIASLTAITGGK